MSSLDATDAIGFYDELLSQTHLASTHEILESETRRRALQYQGRPVCVVLRPCFIDEATYLTTRAAASRVGQAIASVARKLRTDPEARAELRLSGPLELMLGIDQHQDDATVVGRLDGFIGPDGDLQFIEYNPLPGGLADVHELVEVFDSMPVMQAFRTRFDARGSRPLDDGLAALRTAHAQRGGQGSPRIGIVSDRSDNLHQTMPDETPRFMAFAREHDFVVRVAPAEACEYRDHRLHLDGEPVDLVQIASWEALLGRYQFDHPVFDALRESTVRVFNGIASSIVQTSKMLFAYLFDPAYSRDFPPDVADAVRRHVPWTHAFREVHVPYRGQTIDLPAFVALNRTSFVLKPAWGLGGRGVTLGWDCDEATWQKAIATALAGNYVVQERVGIHQERFPLWVDGALQFETLRVGIDPFVWNNAQAEGCFVRVSNSDLLNMTSGPGSNTPLYTVRRRT